jgi:hypothetical protein
MLGGVAAWSEFIAGSTLRSPHTRMQSRTTSRMSPTTSHDRGASAATTPVTARQAPEISATPAA